MGSLLTGRWKALLAVIFLVCGTGGCGGHKVTPASPFPAKITLSPGTNVSAQLGAVFSFTATAQNAAGNNIGTAFTFTSNDTSILTISANGTACAGRWDATFSTCTPGNVGVAEVIATALGSNSLPTFVFVHPPIDNIVVSGILNPNQTVQEPCLSQGQSMTVQATAYSQGVDITASVGPFTWSANNSTVVKLTPIITNTTYNFPTLQAMATGVTPGLTQIYATASGVSSTSFQQPNLTPNPPVIFDFFETCPIQSIALELGQVGSQQTSFVTSKGSSSAETAFATVTDVFGNSSLPNTEGGTVLTKIPLTWSASQPQVIGAGTGCTLSCSLSLPSPGAGAVTASCSPPTCNVGFPEIPAALSPAQTTACGLYIHSQFPQIPSGSCQQFIPAPVYAQPLPNPNPINELAAISGVVNGTPTATTVLTSSVGCATDSPANCFVGLYSFATAKTSSGPATLQPVPPNSLKYDLAGDKVYMGSNFGAQVINPNNLGTANNPFTALGTITGKVIAVSPNGNLAVFSDTFHTPNQVYIVNATSPTAPSITALNISSASVAAFSPDNLKAFISGLDANGNPNVFVYSALQALQTTCWSAGAGACAPMPANTTVNSIAFSTNGAYAYVVEPSLNGGGPAVTVFNTCNNQIAQDKLGTTQTIPLSATPVSFKAMPDGLHFLALENNGVIDEIAAQITPIASLIEPAGSICPANVTHQLLSPINLGQGSIHPIDFFASADGSLLYILASDRAEVLVYNFTVGTVTNAIPLQATKNNPVVTPVAVDMTADAGTIVIAGSDGQVHEITTSVGGNDAFQVQFPDLNNYLNPFCTTTPAQGVCTLDTVLVKP